MGIFAESPKEKERLCQSHHRICKKNITEDFHDSEAEHLEIVELHLLEDSLRQNFFIITAKQITLNDFRTQ